MDGQPFFIINKAVDPGLLTVLENEIVPRLEQEIPCHFGLFISVCGHISGNGRRDSVPLGLYALLQRQKHRR